MSKITLVSASDIALDKLVASDANVRCIRVGVSVEELEEEIFRRELLQSLSVRPIFDGDGAEKGKLAVSAGGRRLAALKLLVKQKRLARCSLSCRSQSTPFDESSAESRRAAVSRIFRRRDNRGTRRES